MTIDEYLNSKYKDIYELVATEGVTAVAEKHDVSRQWVYQVIGRYEYMLELKKRFGGKISTGMAKRLDSKGIQDLQHAKSMGRAIMNYKEFGPKRYSDIQKL
jgi:predicted DNA-binding protein YlxM (UPF0122 family)